MSCTHDFPTGSTRCPSLTELSHCNMDKELGRKYHHVSAYSPAAPAWVVLQQPRLCTTSEPTQVALHPVAHGARREPGWHQALGRCQEQSPLPHGTLHRGCVTQISGFSHQRNISTSWPSSCSPHLGSPGNKLRLFSVCRRPGLLSTGLCVPLQ